MTKILSYSLFGDPSSFEFGFYLRGVYFNARMNRILYPGFITNVFYDERLENDYFGFFEGIKDILGDSFYHREVGQSNKRCEAMLWRMIPLFSTTTHVICRDLDSVSTYREANCVYDWLQSGLPYHAINDNDAHAGLMGGMVGFRSEDFKRDTGYTYFEQMIQGQDLKKHGSDQNFMNKHIHPKIKDGLFMHKLKGQGIEAKRIETRTPTGFVNQKLWVSDLISRYIGSAGVIDFELLRFFKSFDDNPKFDEFEKKFKNICYWRQ
jgi:hypothetical protein